MASEQSLCLLSSAKVMIDKADSARTMQGYKTTFKQVNKFVSENFSRELLNSDGVMVSKPTVEELLAFLESKRSGKPDIRVGTLKNIRSAVNKLIKLNSVGVSEYTDKEMEELRRYFTGCRNFFAQKVTEGERSSKEGKRHLTVEDFQKLCKASLLKGEFRLGRHEAELHFFITIAWTLMARLETATQLHSSCIDWEDDALLIGISKSKRNYSEISHWYRVYANPFQPTCCTVLSLAILCACNTTILSMFLL